MTDRPDASHIRSDGLAKTSYSVEAAAVQVANLVWVRTGVPHGAYLCSQRPDHWHVGRGIHNLKET